MNSPSQFSSLKQTVDFTVQNEGTIFLLHPHTLSAQRWISKHIALDALRFGSAVVVEHRYMCDIIDGIRAAGLGSTEMFRNSTGENT